MTDQLNADITFTQEDTMFMQRAISLAKKGYYTTSPNPRVGCVLVKNGEIIGEGFHQKAGEGHAEVNAINNAHQLGNDTEGATAYVTLEPCSHFGRTPPCAEGLVNAKVSHVVIAMVDPNPKVSGNGIAILESAAITTRVGLLNAEAISLNQGFITLMTTAKPFVRCKLASSLDGKTAMANGESKWITSAESRKDVQRLRAQSCGVISGVDSVLFDNAKMNVRWSELAELKQSYPENTVRQPIRIIIDPQQKLTPEHIETLDFFEQQSSVIIASLATEKNTLTPDNNWPEFVRAITLPATTSGKLDLNNLLLTLGDQGLNDVLIESGARLAGAFIEQNLVDELVLYQAPKLIGDSGKGLAVMPSVEHLASAKKLTIEDVSMIGEDIRTIASFTSV